jgi:toxin-antitoxin system PIN domain toxin
MADFCDVNVPLALNDPSHPFHRAALGWLETASEGGVVMCRAVQISFLRLLTNPKVMGNAVCTNTEAWSVWWSVCEQTLADKRFVLAVNEPPDLSESFIEFSNKRTRAPQVWQDAYLAAFALRAGHRMVTTDGDFRKFSALECLVLEPDTEERSAWR